MRLVFIKISPVAFYSLSSVLVRVFMGISKIGIDKIRQVNGLRTRLRYEASLFAKMFIDHPVICCAHIFCTRSWQE